MKSDDDLNLIRLPRFYLWVGVTDVLLWGTILVINTFFPNGTEKWWTFALFGLFFLIGVLIIDASLVFRIQIIPEKSRFVYRSFLGNTYQIQFSECESFYVTRNTLKLKTKIKAFYIDPFSHNIDSFLYQLRKNNVREIQR